MAHEVDNFQDVLDSRDIIKRIEELESETEDAELTDDGYFTDDGKTDVNPEWEELRALRSLAGEAEGSPDWPHGETLIRDGYFRDYAEQLADDIGAIDSSASWPLNCIDWKRAAEELKVDYFSVDYDGVEYWIRA